MVGSGTRAGVFSPYGRSQINRATAYPIGKAGGNRGAGLEEVGGALDRGEGEFAGAGRGLGAGGAPVTGQGHGGERAEQGYRQEKGEGMAGEPGRVNISGVTFALVRDLFDCSTRGAVEAKNKEPMEMYFVAGRKEGG